MERNEIKMQSILIVVLVRIQNKWKSNMERMQQENWLRKQELKMIRT